MVWSAVVAAVLSAVAVPAVAVIKPDMDVDKVYSLAQSVLVGRITSVDAKNGMVKADIGENLKSRGQGAATPPAFAKAEFDLKALPEVLQYVQVGKPVVILNGRIKGATVHIADNACVVEELPQENPPRYVLSKSIEWTVFPGVTPALVGAIKAVKDNNWTDPNGVMHWMFPRYRQISQLKSAPTAMACGDVNGDGLPDLIALEPGGTEVHLATSGGYEKAALADATKDWGIGDVKASAVAVGDVNGDGKADVILDDTLYVSDGKRFTASKALGRVPAGTKLIAAGIGPTVDGGKADIVLLSQDGLAFIYQNGPVDQPWNLQPPLPLWKEDAANPTQKACIDRFGYNDHLYVMALRSDGPIRYPLNPDDGRPADAMHMAYAAKGQFKPGNTYLALTPLRIETRLGNVKEQRYGRALSLMMFTDKGRDGDMGLMGRRHGVFLLNGRMGHFRHDRKTGKDAGNQVAGSHGNLIIPKICAAAAADLNRKDGVDELIFVTPDCKVFMADNVGTDTVKGWSKRPGAGDWDYFFTNETP